MPIKRAFKYCVCTTGNNRSNTGQVEVVHKPGDSYIPQKTCGDIKIEKCTVKIRSISANLTIDCRKFINVGPSTLDETVGETHNSWMKQ